MPTKKFQWNEGLVISTFHLKYIKEEDNILLNYWLDADTTIVDYESIILEKLRQEARIKISSWNEEELKMNYLSFIVAFAHYNEDEEYNVYFERPISAEVAGHKINVIVDLMIAQGVRDYIQKPYFCFHEYKREKKYNDDPIAQVLLAMLAAQENNKNGKPLYGAYILGRNWYFMVMENKQFSISKGFDCTDKEDLYKIISILRKFKTIIKTNLLDHDSNI